MQVSVDLDLLDKIRNYSINNNGLNDYHHSTTEFLG